MYTRAQLQELGSEYEAAVATREVEIYSKYVGEGILVWAKKGVRKISFPVLKKDSYATYSSQGILNKYDPGPIPHEHLAAVIEKIYQTFPDIDISVSANHLNVSWE